MKESTMNHRKEKADGLMIKQILQCTIVLILSFWLLYQIYHIFQTREYYSCDDVEKKIRNEHIKFRNVRIGKLLGRKGGLGSSHNAERIELHQVDYDTEKKFRNERIGKLLGRRGGLGLSHNAEGMELYGMDLIGAADRIKHVAEDSEENDALIDFTELNDEEEPSPNDANTTALTGEVSNMGELGENMQENKGNTSAHDEGKMLISDNQNDEDEKVWGRNRTEVESLASFGAVILKTDDRMLSVSRVNNENGVLKHDSGPSKRTDILVDSLLKGDSLSLGILSNGIESCLKLLQNYSEQQSLNESDRKAVVVHEEIKDLTPVKSDNGSMRDLLQKDR